MRADTELQSDNARRLIETPDGWYVLTREQSDLGPFRTPEDADTALKGHLRAYRGISNRTPDETYTGFSLHDSEGCSKTNCGRCAEALAIRNALEAVS